MVSGFEAIGQKGQRPRARMTAHLIRTSKSLYYASSHLREQNMLEFRPRSSLLAAGALAGLICAATAPKLAAQQGASVPDFSSNDMAWVLADRDGDYIPVPGEPTPTLSDPAHPHYGNNTGHPTYRVADLNNPNIKPWAKAVMKRENDKVLAGGMGFAARQSCMAAGVPAFLSMAVVESIHFYQAPKQVTMIFSGDEQVRRVYLDAQHSANPKPSWYGESVGHYEGDTLVVDTIGMNEKTYLDGFRTPHSGRLHVVERYKLTDGGKTIQVTFKVDDPDTFYAPWTAIQNLRRVQRPWHEEVCAENNEHLFDYGMPVANKMDF
jgi:hypothetical protein